MGSLGLKPPGLVNPIKSPTAKEIKIHFTGSFHPRAERGCFLVNHGMAMAKITINPLLPYSKREEGSWRLSNSPKPKLILTINDTINRRKYAERARRTSFFISLFYVII